MAAKLCNNGKTVITVIFLFLEAEVIVIIETEIIVPPIKPIVRLQRFCNGGPTIAR